MITQIAMRENLAKFDTKKYQYLNYFQTSSN